MKHIRILVLNGIQHNRRVTCKHILSRDNILSDSLSRLDCKCFGVNTLKSMCSKQDEITPKLWLIDWFWNNQDISNIKIPHEPITMVFVKV